MAFLPATIPVSCTCQPSIDGFLRVLFAEVLGGGISEYKSPEQTIKHEITLCCIGLSASRIKCTSRLPVDGKSPVCVIIIIIIYLLYIALNPCTVLSASQLKGVTLHH